jgi:hypothetical protein
MSFVRHSLVPPAFDDLIEQNRFRSIDRVEQQQSRMPVLTLVRSCRDPVSAELVAFCPVTESETADFFLSDFTCSTLASLIHLNLRKNQRTGDRFRLRPFFVARCEHLLHILLKPKTVQIWLFGRPDSSDRARPDSVLDRRLMVTWSSVTFSLSDHVPAECLACLFLLLHHNSIISQLSSSAAPSPS